MLEAVEAGSPRFLLAMCFFVLCQDPLLKEKVAVFCCAEDSSLVTAPSVAVGHTFFTF